MATKSLADRVVALEGKVGNKSIEEQFREQAELIDRVFAYRFEELDKTWAPRFANVERTVGAVQKDVAIVRQGISVLLKRPRQ